MNITENDVVTENDSFDEFVELAKLANSIFKPFDRNFEDASRFFWNKHAEVVVTQDRVEKEEAEKTKPRPYPFTNDASLFNFLMEEKHDVSEKPNFFNLYLLIIAVFPSVFPP